MPGIIIAQPTQSAAQSIALLIRQAGQTVTATCEDGYEALMLTLRHRPDAVIAHLFLPGLDAPALLKRVRALPIDKTPLFIATCPPSARVALPDGLTMMREPYTPQALTEALGASERALYADESRARRARALMEKLSVPEHAGREYLVWAILMVMADRRHVHSLSKTVYPAVAKRFGVSARRVESAMRHAVNRAWNTGDIDVQYGLFGNTVDEQHGKPSMGGMIARAADILRLEEADLP